MKGADEKMDWKTVEKNRRIHMKSLCFKLSSLIPKQDFISKEPMTQQDHLDRAAAYIQRLRERIERLKKRKELGMCNAQCAGETDDLTDLSMKLPVIKVRHQEQQNLEVILISGLRKGFFFHEVNGILEEEGAEVVNASFSAVGNKEEIQRLLYEHNATLDAKKQDFELEMSNKRRSFDDEVKNHTDMLDKEKRQIRCKDEQTIKREEALENRKDKLKTEEKNLDAKSKALKE